jgi:hypothetical protein
LRYSRDLPTELNAKELPNMLYRRAVTGRLLAALILLTTISWATVSTGCGSPPKPDQQPVEGPDYSNDAVLRLAQHISSRADAVMMVRSIEDLVEQTHQVVDVAKAATGSDKPTARISAFGQYFGIDFDRVESWKKTGLRTDTPVFLAFGNEPVLVAELADETRFYQFLEGLYERDENFDDDSWIVNDGVAYIALDDKRALSVVTDREDAFSVGSLSDDLHFRTFREEILDEHLLGVYVPGGSELMNQAISEIVSGLSGRYQPLFTQHILWGVFSDIQGFGLAGGVEAGSLRADAWLGVSEETRRHVSALLESPRVQQWDQHLLQDGLLLWSTSIDPKLGWDSIAYALSTKTRTRMREDFDKLRAEKKIDFDIERDLVDYLSGHSAVMVYPLDKKASRYASMSIDGFGIIFMFTFTDPVVPKHLAQIIQDITASQGRTRAIVRLADGQDAGGTVQVLDFGSPHAPKIYVRDTLVAFASGSFDEATMVEIFNNTDRSKRLVNSETHALAKKMFSSVQENTLYLNWAPLFAELRKRDRADIGPWADLLEEALVTVSVTNTGIVATGELRSAAALGFAPYVLNRELIEDEVRMARYELQAMSRKASSYYMSRQRSCNAPATCAEPWHASSPDRYIDSNDQKVFPGGLNQEWHSRAKIPTSAQQTKPAPIARKHAEQTMKMLGFSERNSSAFRFTYITNGITGPGAQVIVRAEADFDPTSPEIHVLEQTLTVDANGRVSTSDVVETNAFE